MRHPSLPLDPTDDADPPLGRRLVQVALALAAFTVLVGLVLPMRYVQGSTLVECGSPVAYAPQGPECAAARDVRHTDVATYGAIFVGSAAVVVTSRRLQQRADLAGVLRALAGMVLAIALPAMLLAVTSAYRPT